MKIKELINYGRRLLKENEVEDSSTISKILASYILNMDRIQIVVKEEQEIAEEQKIRYYLGLIEIIQGMPIQYITNKQEFMKIQFYVDENVLIPQPDTEILVEEVIEIAKKYKENLHILDICTGSGCIGISLSKNLENADITMSDISIKALEIAKKNYERNIKDNKIKFVQSNMFENITERYDIIVSNPPYIKTDKIKSLPENVKREPNIALDGGKEGLDFYKILISEAPKYLNEEGYLCIEIGYDQKDEIIKIINESTNYSETYSKKDLSGNDRIIVAKKI